MQRDFAAIRTISDRQVLAWVEETHEMVGIHIQFKFNGGAEADMKIQFQDDADDSAEATALAVTHAYEALDQFNAGDLDPGIAQQIASTEADFPLTTKTPE